MGVLRLVLFLAVVLAAYGCGSDGPDRCPEPTEDGFHVPFGVRWDAEKALKEELNDPGSYQRSQISTFGLFKQERDDGSAYFEAIVIEFRAKNTFGALVKGRARIDLEEIDGECKVKAVDIIEGAALQVVRPGDERETF